MKQVRHYRRGTADENAMGQTRLYARVLYRHGLSLADKVVLDVGAHIGTFSRLALDAGARRVIAYEPHRKNFALLKKNCPEADLHRAALVSDDRTVTPLVVGPRWNPRVGTERFSTSRSATRGNIVVDRAVPCERFRDAVRGVDVIKFDAEGAEYDLFNAVDVPVRVEFIVGEFDCSGSFRLPSGEMTGGVMKSNYKPLWDLIKRIEDQGFEYHGPRYMVLPRDVRLIHVLFVRGGR